MFNDQRKITIGLVEIVLTTAAAAVLALLGWMAKTLIEVDKRTAVMAMTVAENNEMMRPVWEDYIKRQASYSTSLPFDEELTEILYDALPDEAADNQGSR